MAEGDFKVGDLVTCECHGMMGIVVEIMLDRRVYCRRLEPKARCRRLREKRERAAGSAAGSDRREDDRSGDAQDCERIELAKLWWFKPLQKYYGGARMWIHTTKNLQKFEPEDSER